MDYASYKALEALTAVSSMSTDGTNLPSTGPASTTDGLLSGLHLMNLARQQGQLQNHGPRSQPQLASHQQPQLPTNQLPTNQHPSFSFTNSRNFGLNKLNRAPGMNSLNSSPLFSPLGLNSASSNYPMVNPGLNTFGMPDMQVPQMVYKKRRISWSREECVKMLHCTYVMLECDLKTITKAIYACINRPPGKSSGRAAEKKLKRLISFKNWKACNKRVVTEIIQKKLRMYHSSVDDIDPKVLACCKHFKEQYILERGLFEQARYEEQLRAEAGDPAVVDPEAKVQDPPLPATAAPLLETVTEAKETVPSGN